MMAVHGVIGLQRAWLEVNAHTVHRKIWLKPELSGQCGVDNGGSLWHAGPVPPLLTKKSCRLAAI